ncbi:MAG: hypothetical protein WCS92_01225 [Candidatus Babeliales bacterium]
MAVFRRRVSFLIMSVVALGAVSGCARYSAQPLNRIKTVSPHKQDGSEKPEKAISLAYNVYDKWDCKKYLNRDVLAKGYQPVQITITNNSDRYINFSKENISLPTVPAADVAKRVHTSTMTRAVSYGVAGLFLWPFFIPAVVDGVKSSQANQRLDEDFAKKELADQIISPYNTINGLIFVPKNEFSRDFTVTAVDVEKRVRFALNSNKLFLKI